MLTALNPCDKARGKKQSVMGKVRNTTGIVKNTVAGDVGKKGVENKASTNQLA